jgi:hypothetical protein
MPPRRFSMPSPWWRAGRLHGGETMCTKMDGPGGTDGTCWDMIEASGMMCVPFISGFAASPARVRPMSTPMPSTPPMPSSSNFDVRMRLRAMFIHLGLSCLVAAMLAAMVFLVWYPPPFSDMSGGRELFLVVV